MGASELTKPNELFPLTLRLIQMNYALAIFGYLKRREDTNLKAEGDRVLGHMQRFRQCLPPNASLYYDILRPVLKELFRYPGVEEQASISSHYEGQRNQIISNLRAVLREMESQDDLMDYLDYMLVKVVVGVEDTSGSDDTLSRAEL